MLESVKEKEEKRRRRIRKNSCGRTDKRTDGLVQVVQEVFADLKYRKRDWTHFHVLV